MSNVVWAGSPVNVEVGGGHNFGDGPLRPRLARLPHDSAGLVYVIQRGQLVSRPLIDAFSGWPPKIGERVMHGQWDFGLCSAGDLSSQPDGTFAMHGDAQGFVCQIAVAGAILSGEYTGLSLEPHNGGAVITASYDHAGQSHRLARQRLGAPGAIESLGSVPWRRDAALITLLPLGDGAYLIACTDALGAYDAGRSPVYIHRIDASGERLTDTRSAPLLPRSRRLLPRASGGAWLALEHPNRGLVVYTIDAAGHFTGEPWTRPTADSKWAPRPAFASLRDDLVVAESGPEGVTLLIFDGERVTAVSATITTPNVSDRQLSILTSEDERSLLVAVDMHLLRASYVDTPV